MHHKSLVFLIQSHSRKLFLINDLYSLGYGQCFGGAIVFSDKLPFCKPYVYITKTEEKHSQDYFYFGVGPQKSFLEESNLFQLILELKACYDHPKNI